MTDLTLILEIGGGLVAALVVAGFFFRKKKPTGTIAETDGQNEIEKTIPTSPSPPAKPPQDPYLSGLSKTRSTWNPIKALFSRGKLGTEERDQLEEILISSDLGARLTQKLLNQLDENSDDIKNSLPRLLEQNIKVSTQNFVTNRPEKKPFVAIFVGVNGAGKTTTIGKIANQLRDQKVLVVAGDTFRAAATEQLAEWCKRSGSTLLTRPDADPSSLIFDGIKTAQAENYDFVLIDTAGRLQTKVPLMDELKKLIRTVKKLIPDGPHEALLVMDANTGQNGLSQAKLFHEAVGLTGVVLTKLDGTAKGGIAFAVGYEIGIPLTWVGLGENINDLQWIDPKKYVDNLIGQ